MTARCPGDAAGAYCDGRRYYYWAGARCATAGSGGAGGLRGAAGAGGHGEGGGADGTDLHQGGSWR